MNPAQMAARCPHSPQRGTGWLEGWRLTFGGEDLSWEGALGTVVEDADERVFVVLYDLTEADGDALAWLYVVNAYEGGLPSALYLGAMADAAEVAGAPEDYVADLRGRPCSSVA